MKISIIIINYNTEKYIIDLLNSIGGKLDYPYEIIIVDNNSKDKLDINKFSSFSNTRVFSLTKNLGFGGGNNFGAKQATGEILWFLNPDTLIQDQSINKAINFLTDHKECGVVSPLLYNDLGLTELQDDMIANFQTLKTLILRTTRPEFALDMEYSEADMVVAASIFIRRDLFERIGGFDEKIFMFMEDDDLCYRVKKEGLKIYIYNGARIIHLKGKSIKKDAERKRMYYRSQNYFWQKHYGAFWALVMRIIRFPRKLISTL